MELENTRYYSHGEPGGQVTARLLMNSMFENGVFRGWSKGWLVEGPQLLVVEVPAEEAKDVEAGHYDVLHDTVDESDNSKTYNMKRRAYIAEKIAHTMGLRLHELMNSTVQEYVPGTKGVRLVRPIRDSRVYG